MKRFSIIILVFIGCIETAIYAQQDPQFTQYTINPLAVNSAYAGSRGHTTITGLHRTQWVGIDGAPRTQTLSIDSPIGKRVGLGLSVINDELGPSEEIYGDLNFSYTVPINDNYKLAFGLKGGFRVFNLDFSKGRIREAGDSGLQEQRGLDNKFFPTAGAGLFLHSKRKYLGVSLPNVLRVEHFDQKVEDAAVERLHLFVIGGWVMPMGQSNNLFKPAFLVKHVNGAPLIVDLSANFLLFEKLRLGLAWRWDDSVSGLVGFQISRNLMAAYTYDYTTTELQNYNSGTHEITLRFEIFKDRILKSPRFF